MHLNGSPDVVGLRAPWSRAWTPERSSRSSSRSCSKGGAQRLRAGHRRPARQRHRPARRALRSPQPSRDRAFVRCVWSSAAACVQPGHEFSVHHGVAAGTERWVDVHPHASPGCRVEQLVARGFELIRPTPRASSFPEDLAGLPRRRADPGKRASRHRRGFCGAGEPQRAHPHARVRREPQRQRVGGRSFGRGDSRPQRATSRRSARRHLYARALFCSVPRAAEVLRSFRVALAESDGALTRCLVAGSSPVASSGPSHAGLRRYASPCVNGPSSGPWFAIDSPYRARS